MLMVLVVVAMVVAVETADLNEIKKRLPCAANLQVVGLLQPVLPDLRHINPKP